MSAGKLILVACVIVAAIATPFLWLWPDAQFPDPAAPPLAAPSGDPGQIERGEYLAKIGDCKACHTRRGGAPYGGGRAIPTPFGTFYTPNITPHAEAGIGRWSADDFWRSLHDGVTPDGKMLYPSFPYTNYTRVTREDSDAIFAYVRTLAPSADTRRPHELRFPYRYRVLLAGWRALFFRPGTFEADPVRSPAWNRGAYLVQGLGHCSACHEARNRLGAIASNDNPAGGLVLSWYAPSLYSSSEAGLQQWTAEDSIALLRDGKNRHASVLGPMAEVVYESLQYLSTEDAQAMAEYLRDLPDSDPLAAQRVAVPKGPRARALSERGATLYQTHCADCHGDDGEGVAGKAGALAGNRAVTMGSVVNLVRVIRYGGYPPGTEGNPRPSGMPPFQEQLNSEEIAAVITYLRGLGGADAVSTVEIERYRGGPNW